MRVDCLEPVVDVLQHDGDERSAVFLLAGLKDILVESIHNNQAQTPLCMKQLFSCCHCIRIGSGLPALPMHSKVIITKNLGRPLFIENITSINIAPETDTICYRRGIVNILQVPVEQLQVWSNGQFFIHRNG